MRIVTYQLNRMRQKYPDIKFYKILKSDINQREMDNAGKVYDQNWVNYLQVNQQAFHFYSDVIPKAKSTTSLVQHSPSKNGVRVGIEQQSNFLQMMETKQKVAPAAVAGF